MFNFYQGHEYMLVILMCAIDLWCVIDLRSMVRNCGTRNFKKYMQSVRIALCNLYIFTRIKYEINESMIEVYYYQQQVAVYSLSRDLLHFSLQYLTCLFLFFIEINILHLFSSRNFQIILPYCNNSLSKFQKYCRFKS